MPPFPIIYTTFPYKQKPPRATSSIDRTQTQISFLLCPRTKKTRDARPPTTKAVKQERKLKKNNNNSTLNPLFETNLSAGIRLRSTPAILLIVLDLRRRLVVTLARPR